MIVPKWAAVESIALAVIIMLVPGSSLAGDGSSNRRTARSGGDHDVVSGNYYCSGSTYTDEQSAEITVSFYLGATSSLTSGYSAPYRRTRNVSADLGTMSEICRTQVDTARARMPSVCALGVIEEEGGEFGNGASISLSFQFTCEGTRNEVIGVVGELARLIVGSRLPSDR